MGSPEVVLVGKISRSIGKALKALKRADRYVEEQAVLAELFEAEPAARSVAPMEAAISTVEP